MNAELIQKLQAYKEADKVFASWIVGAQTLGLLRGAFRVGILDGVRSPRTASQIAAMTNLDESNVINICEALVAQGVLELNDNQKYQLTPDFVLLSSPDTVFLLEDRIDTAFAQTHLLEELDFKESYSSLPPQIRLALAHGDSINPASPVFQQLRTDITHKFMPEWENLCVSGGHHLELGCGVGGGLLALILAYPKMTGIGLDIDPNVLEAARENASKLGVSKRVDWRLCDASTITYEGIFDTVFWSQSYFPPETRVATLQAALRALKPNGLLYAPTQNTTTQIEREYALSHLLHSTWGLPALSLQNLREELQQAGFEFVRIVPNYQNQGILVKRP